MANVGESKPIKSAPSETGKQTAGRIYNEASELYSRLRTVGENFTRWEEPGGRHHLLKIEGNQLVYTVINQNVEPQQGKRIVYHCNIGENGELIGVTGKEYTHFKGEPKAKVSINTALIIQMDGFTKRVFGKTGDTVSWQDVLAEGLLKPQQPQPALESAPESAPASPPASEHQHETPPTGTNSVEFQTVSGKFYARGKDISDAWYDYSINIPKDWVKKDDIYRHGFDVHPANDPVTGIKLYNKPDGNTVEEIIKNYTDMLVKQYGIRDIKINQNESEKSQEGDTLKAKSIITFKDKNGKEYKTAIHISIVDPFGVLGAAGTFHVPHMPLQQSLNPLLAPNPYLLQQMRDSVLRTIAVETTPVENEEKNTQLFEEIKKSTKITYGTPPSGPAPQKIIIEIPGLKPPEK